MAGWRSPWLLLLVTAASLPGALGVGDDNNVYNPCGDLKVKKSDGFAFGIAFGSWDSFYRNGIQFSPCDSRLQNANSHLAIFRPLVDEISLLFLNGTSFPSISKGTYMVAFAGRKYAARSVLEFVANDTYIITSFTLVVEFQAGTLKNFYWKKDGCSQCSGSEDSACINGSCAIKTSSCKIHGGDVDCSVSFQVAFSGTDRYDAVLNSGQYAASYQENTASASRLRPHGGPTTACRIPAMRIARDGAATRRSSASPASPARPEF